jgi:lipoprotein-releasing system permease protein
LISAIERAIAFRYLRPKKKEGFLKVISVFSFTGIALGVAILIIVMSVMNGFRTELINKILGFNPHIIIKPYDKKIDKQTIDNLDPKLKNKISRTAFTFNGQGILINKINTTGILVRSYIKNDINNVKLLKSGIIDGSLDKFENNTISIGKELAISLDLIVGDEISLMSTKNLQTPFGNLPLQEKFKISSVFNTGLVEFDQNVIFMPIDNAISLFELSETDIDLEIFLKKPEKVELIKDDIQRIFNNHYVYTWADLNKSFFGALKVERNVMFIILTLIIIVAAFNIISGLTILVKNKTKEIAILRTMGISKKSIGKIFFLIGFTIGLIATITGVLIGVLFSYYIEEIRTLITSIFNIQLFPEEIYFLSQMPSEINLNYILIVSFFSLLITFFATIFPSLAAAKLDPIKALKYE